MIGEIIAIGNELTTGRILNSTSNFAAGHLFAAGHEIMAMVTVGDDLEGIGQTLKKSLARADFVIVTGGLGPTSDDLTTEAAASALERPITFYPEILKAIQAGPSHSSGPGPRQSKKAAANSLEKMAWLPTGAEVLKPEARMAGYLLIHDGKPIFFLPGVPYEMKELMLDCVIPRLASWQAQPANRVRLKIYKTLGLNETEINARLHGLEQDSSRVRIGYYPVYPEVHISLTVLGDNDRETHDLFQRLEQGIIAALGSYLYGVDNESLEKAVGALLREGGMTLALAESCTGGMIAHKITMVAGSSDYFLGGVVAYSNSLKERLLRVAPEILAQHGAVSAQTAQAMAEGIRRITGADIALSVTGIAGPGGGAPEKPVGTVYFALATAESVLAFQREFSGVRWQIQTMSAHVALDLIRRQLLHLLQ